MFKLKTNILRHHNPAFTIVELLVVIVVIGILAAITIVSYTGISQRANLASAQSDLSNATTQLKSYYAIYGAYPILDGTTNCPIAPSTIDNNYCLRVSNGNTLTYSIDHKLDGTVDYTDFGLSIKSNAANTYLTNSASDLRCPSNFIPVPGSATYGTNDFCVMKYIASQVGSTTTPISQPNALPWVSISQTTAIANAPNVAGCTGCHLITEAEWMTLAQNVLSVASNWDNGAGVHTVGTGYIYSGHNDNAPANALTADPSDANGYAGTGNVSPSNQKRTLILTNGQVIWDLAGNVWEWTTGQTTGGQPTGMASWNYYDWTTVSGGSLAINPFPSSTSISGSSTWASANGIGKIYGLTSDASLRGFLRSGSWSNGGSAGVLTLALDTSPSSTSGYGFRVSR